MINQLTKPQAKALFATKFWEKLTDEQLVRFQLFQKRLCMPFEVFHHALSVVFDRPVYIDEFAYPNKLRNEYFGITYEQL